MEQDQARRLIAKTMLEALQETTFVLTGASALMEHGLISRETKDVDLFAANNSGMHIPDAIEPVRTALAKIGAEVEIERELPEFVAGKIRYANYEIGFDLGIDWRAYPPVNMEIGPVLDIRDSAGSKVAALYSRNELRDYMDVASIVLSGRWTPAEVLALGKNNDPSIEEEQLAATLNPGSPRFPRSENFRVLGYDIEDENKMRDALEVLRHAVLGREIDIETVSALRVAQAGAAQPLVDSLMEVGPVERAKVHGKIERRGMGYER
ncbi:nucleotidyl transferase AbiEii/AbiGii toxin family protein [Dermabacteraceae bacterium CCM 9519]